MSKVILFGAGASYGSEQSTPYCPPLGAGLFDELQKRYPDAWGTVPKEKRGLFVPNFEPGMKELWDSNWHGTSALMRAMADYFAMFRPLEGNSYSRLIEHLSSHGAIAGTTFSTLNYECLLEYAIRNNRLKLRYDSPEPSSAETLSILKIHGSCNFLPASVSASAAAISYSANSIGWDGEIRIVDVPLVRPFVTHNAFYPAMAIFMEGKPVRSHQGAISMMQTWWKEAVLKADRIGIVGVKPNVPDDHIWGPLAESNSEVVVIGDTTAYECWGKQYRAGKVTEVVGNRFAPSLAEFAKRLSR